MIEEKRLSELMPETINRMLEILDALGEEMKERSEPLIFTVTVQESGIIPLEKTTERTVIAKLISIGPRFKGDKGDEIPIFQEKKWYVDTIDYEEVVKDEQGKIISQEKQTLLE